jgi:hypothetical protein
MEPTLKQVWRNHVYDKLVHQNALLFRSDQTADRELEAQAEQEEAEERAREAKKKEDEKNRETNIFSSSFFSFGAKAEEPTKVQFPRLCCCKATACVLLGEEEAASLSVRPDSQP